MFNIETAITGTESQIKWATEIRRVMLVHVNQRVDNAKRRASEDASFARLAEITEETAATAVKNLEKFTAAQIIAGKDRNFGDFIAAAAQKKFNAEVAK